MLIFKSENFRTETNGKRFHPYAAPTADEIVTHLMHEDDDPKHDKEWNDRADQNTVGAEKIQQEVSQATPPRDLISPAAFRIPNPGISMAN